MERAIPALRDHLDRIGFVQLYKLLVTPGAYHTSPNVLGGSRPERAAGLASCVTGGAAELGLAACLMLEARVPRGELAPRLLAYTRSAFGGRESPFSSQRASKLASSPVCSSP